jgi:hypothetical protein
MGQANRSCWVYPQVWVWLAAEVAPSATSSATERYRSNGEHPLAESAGRKAFATAPTERPSASGGLWRTGRPRPLDQVGRRLSRWVPARGAPSGPATGLGERGHLPGERRSGGCPRGRPRWRQAQPAARGDAAHATAPDDRAVGRLTLHHRVGAHRIAPVSGAAGAKQAAACLRLARSARRRRCSRRRRPSASCSPHAQSVAARAVVQLRRFVSQRRSGAGVMSPVYQAGQPRFELLRHAACSRTLQR